MALVKSFVRPSGDAYGQAYHRVTAVLLYHREEVAHVRVETYRDQSARDAGLVPVAEAREFQVREEVAEIKAVAEVKDANGKVTTAAVAGRARLPGFTEVFGGDVPPLTAAYGYLKALPEFSGASSV